MTHLPTRHGAAFAMTDARESNYSLYSLGGANEAAGTARLLKVLINTQRSEKCCEHAASCVLNAVYARTPNGIATLLSVYFSL